jgi:hypothetical protein
MRVRAALAFDLAVDLAVDLPFVMAFVMALPPLHRVEQRLDDASLREPGGCMGARRVIIYPRYRRAAKHGFSGRPEIFSWPRGTVSLVGL